MTERKTVMVVDDDTDYLEFCRFKLEGEFEVDSAKDGEEAIVHLSRARPGMVFLDLSMPMVSGLGVLEYMSLFPELRDVPVVIVTAMRLAPDVKSELQANNSVLYILDKLEAVKKIDTECRKVMRLTLPYRARPRRNT